MLYGVLNKIWGDVDYFGWGVELYLENFMYSFI